MPQCAAPWPSAAGAPVAGAVVEHSCAASGHLSPSYACAGLG